jgi:major membrane immunogen (membrane-anchored lipoprotein)
MNHTAICIITLSLFAFSLHNSDIDNVANAGLKDTSSNYMDGTYQGQSQATYTSEPFWGHIQISIENSSFTAIQFFIRDSSLHENVDSMYGVNHYAGYPLYMQQCVDDGHGIEIYPQKLLESQDLDNVDAISGATWSHHIFIASAGSALKDAKKPTSIDSRSETDKISVNVLPNPFYSTLTLEYSLTKKCYVNLSIYDNQGKLLKQLVDQEQLAGPHNIQWNDCPSAGIYYYRLQTDNTVLCNKLIRLKK